MSIVDVALGPRSYPIWIESNGLHQLGQRLTDRLGSRRVMLITDDNVASYYLEPALRSLVDAGHRPHHAVIKPGETSKTIATVSSLWEKLLRAGADRSTVIVALGGGVVGDVAGFVAATYNRGIPFVQVPTSLLAQVDSSVGGKTGFNLGGIKNVIGAFHQPTFVLACLETLVTLPVQELRSGLGEVVKHGVLCKPDLLPFIRSNSKKIEDRDSSVITTLVSTCCEVKRDVVVADEFERGHRKLLNLGHTFGHAIETVSQHAVSHGEAVAIGLVAASRLSEKLSMCDTTPRTQIIETLRSIDLPVEDAPFWTPEVARAMVLDKKRQEGEIDIVMLRGLGDPIIHRIGLDTLVTYVSGGGA